MNVAEFLKRRDVDSRAITAAVEASIGLAPSDSLLAVGSLAEGLGNDKSDLDLLLIVGRDRADLVKGDVAVVVGRCLFDIQVLDSADVDRVAARLAAWVASPWDISHLSSISAEDRRLLHRLLHCTIVSGGSHLEAFKLLGTDLARLKLQVARFMGRTIQIDMAGLAEEADWTSLVFASQDLLGHAADALAAGHLLTNPTAKWRVRLLEKIPNGWDAAVGLRPCGMSAAAMYWSLHRAPEQAQRQGALQHALQAATFARAVFHWSERVLLPGLPEPHAAGTLPLLAARLPGPALPYLAPDVDFSQRAGSVHLARLNEFQPPLELTIPQFRMALRFDGVTTAEEAGRAVLGDDPVAGQAAEELAMRLLEAGLCVPSPPAAP